MAIADLLEKAKASLSDGHGHEHDDDDGLDVEIPDDLSELEAVDLDPDPKPRRRTTAAKPAAPGRAAARVTAAQKRQVRENIELAADMFCLGWSFRDDVCPVVLSEHQEAIIDRVMPLIMRRPAWVEFLTGREAALLEWVALGKVLSPVAKVIWQHHVTHSIGQREGVDSAHHHGDSFDYPAPHYG